MKKNIVNIQLMNMPILRERQRENCPNRSRFHNKTECPIIINTRMLCETASNPTSFVAFQTSIFKKLMLENPFARDDIGARRPRHEIPGVIGDKSRILSLHSSAPVWVSESTAKGLRDGRELSTMKSNIRLPKTQLATGSHGVLIYHGWNRCHACRKRRPDGTRSMHRDAHHSRAAP